MKTINRLKGIFSLVLLFAVGSVSLAQIEEQTSFESLNDGVKLQDNQWTALGFNKTDGNETRFEIDDSESKSGSKSLMVSYPKGKGGLNNSGGQDVLLLSPKNEYYLSYWVKFDPSFDWGDPSKSVGGKLPGLSGGGANEANAGCSGGENCNGNNGFSIRYMWRKDGNAILYVYDMDKPGTYPTDLPLRKSNGKQIIFEKGEWIHLVMRVKINTVSGGNANKDGEIEVWVNSEKVFGPEDKKFRFVKNGDKVEKFLFSTFHGGSSSSWAPRRNNTAWFDDVLITENLSDVFDTADDDNDNVPNSIDGCPNDPNKSEPGICGCNVAESSCSFEEQFDDETMNLRGATSLAKVEIEETACGELHIKDKTLGKFDPLFLDILNPTDISENPVIEIRVRSTEPVAIRLDLRDENGTNKTDGNSGRIEKEVKGDPLLWQILRYEYPLEAFTEKNVDITKIKTIDISFNSGDEGFPGEVFIDYIAIGTGLGNANSTCISGEGTPDCLNQPGGDAYRDVCGQCVGGESTVTDCSAENLFENQFDDQTVDITGNDYVVDGLVILEETGCGELKIQDNGSKTYTNLFVNTPSPIDMSGNPKLVLSIRATDDFNLRIDVRDANNKATNQSGGRINQNITGNGEWKEYTFDYPEIAFTAGGVDPTQIERLGLVFDAGTAGFPGTIWIDYIAIGDPTGIGNATDVCQIGKDCNGDANGSAIFDTNCETCVGGNTGLTEDWCIMSVQYEVQEEAMQLYPNPTNGMVYLSESVAWELLSVQQQQLDAGEGTSINLSALDTGIYLVKFNNKVHRIVKQ